MHARLLYCGEMLKEMKKLRNKKILIIGYIFIIMGIAELILSQVLGGTDFQIGLSGIMLGISIPEQIAFAYWLIM